MKKWILTIGCFVLAFSMFAQHAHEDGSCDCPSCVAKGLKTFTLPGLQGLNESAECDEDHDHAGHVHGESVEQTLLSAHTEHDGHVHTDGADECCPSELEDEAAHADECNHDHDDHAGHDAADHAGHDDAEHAGHDHGDHVEGIELSAEMMAGVGIQLKKAEAGTVARASVFPAEIKLNRDRASAVSPRYPSIVRQIFAEIGDEVRKGDLLASLENRETMAVYSVSAPRDGVVISKDLAVGETASEDRILYEVADLSSVWADISIFPKYQHLIHKGMAVELIARDGHTARGTIQYISPLVNHETRTFTARCVLEGAREDFTPGVFVRARITIEQADVPVAVPMEAVQMLDGHPVVFVPGDHGFQTLEVRTGLSDGKQVEILSGLQTGDEYVAQGSFVLKAAMVTSGMDPHAGHGH